MLYVTKLIYSYFSLRTNCYHASNIAKQEREQDQDLHHIGNRVFGLPMTALRSSEKHEQTYTLKKRQELSRRLNLDREAMPSDKII
jgi:hypothetical protein